MLSFHETYKSRKLHVGDHIICDGKYKAYILEICKNENPAEHKKTYVIINDITDRNGKKIGGIKYAKLEYLEDCMLVDDYNKYVDCKQMKRLSSDAFLSSSLLVHGNAYYKQFEIMKEWLD